MTSLDVGFLLNILTQLRLSEQAIALALIYTHKYYKWQKLRSQRVLSSESLALAATSLAAKAAEKPRRLREILVPAYK